MTRMHAPVALLFSSVWLITFGVLQCSAGRTYVYKPREVNFKQAQEQCKEYGMVVAIADTVEDIEAMNSYLEPLGSVEAWLGMVYTGNGKQFSWVNGESVTAHRWDVTADDEPDNLATQKCAVWRRRDNQWDSRECDNVYHLLCSTGDHSFLYTTYSLYLKDSMFDQQAAATVTSNTNIECAVSCQTLDHCVYFSHQRALHQCLLYTSTSTPSATRATEGQQIWISD
ncbi:uncharacterized protein LOC124272694 [Haliotis rubra]|uniref:uncharacterized protein LOC124272694 n=1 Tax=Haliotis rubra TaxID=36100 RepID=UPI001EE5EC3E|nr:uncharacterized protein LOC124272694 [Haliotis rubra]